MTAPTDCSPVIPVNTPELLELLCADPGVAFDDRDRLRSLAEHIGQHYHHDLRSRLVALKNAYAPFDPDSDTTRVLPLSAQEKQLGSMACCVTWCGYWITPTSTISIAKRSIRC